MVSHQPYFGSYANYELRQQQIYGFLTLTFNYASHMQNCVIMIAVRWV